MKRRSYRRTLIRLSRLALMVPLLWQLSAQAQENSTQDAEHRSAWHERHAQALAERRAENPALAAELDQLRAERQQRQAAFAEKYPEVSKMMAERRAAMADHPRARQAPGGAGRGMRFGPRGGQSPADSDEG